MKQILFNYWNIEQQFNSPTISSYTYHTLLQGNIYVCGVYKYIFSYADNTL